MIYFCADDYGLDEESCVHINECIEKGVLNKVSVFANFGQVDLNKLSLIKDLRLSLHLNLVEGKCMSDANQIGLIVDDKGNFKHTFTGLMKMSCVYGKAFEAQVYKEIRAQVLYWKSVLPQGKPFCIDSHQHVHMIPGVFKALLKVLGEEKIDLEYMRIPTEPLLPYIKVPSLYLTYSGVNVIKQWLVNFLWLVNKKQAEKSRIKQSYFFGILLSGKMDEKRVKKILPQYIKMAEKNNMDIEVVFHPGYLENKGLDLKSNNIVFEDFYMSENRKKEFEAVMNLERSEV